MVIGLSKWKKIFLTSVGIGTSIPEVVDSIPTELSRQSDGRSIPEVVGSIPTEVKKIFSLPRVVPCFPLLGLRPSGLFMDLSSTLIYTSELILSSTICVPSATRHNIHMYPLLLDSLLSNSSISQSHSKL